MSTSLLRGLAWETSICPPLYCEDWPGKLLYVHLSTARTGLGNFYMATSLLRGLAWETSIWPPLYCEDWPGKLLYAHLSTARTGLGNFYMPTSLLQGLAEEISTAKVIHMDIPYVTCVSGIECGMYEVN